MPRKKLLSWWKAKEWVSNWCKSETHTSTIWKQFSRSLAGFWIGLAILWHKLILLINKTMKKTRLRRKCSQKFKHSVSCMNCCMKSVMTMRKKYFRIYRLMKIEETWYWKCHRKCCRSMKRWANYVMLWRKLLMASSKILKRSHLLWVNVLNWCSRILKPILGSNDKLITTEL